MTKDEFLQQIAEETERARLEEFYRQEEEHILKANAMKHTKDAISYWVRNAPENMAVPFIITVDVKYDRAYTLEGTNVFSDGELCIMCRQYIEDIDRTVVRHLGHTYAENEDFEDTVLNAISADLKDNPVRS